MQPLMVIGDIIANELILKIEFVNEEYPTIVRIRRLVIIGISAYGRCVGSDGYGVFIIISSDN